MCYNLNMNQKGKIVLAFVIVVIIAIVGYFVLSNKQVPTTQQSITPPSTSAQTATYSDSKNGFQLQYPSNFYLYNNNEGVATIINYSKLPHQANPDGVGSDVANFNLFVYGAAPSQTPESLASVFQAPLLQTHIGSYDVKIIELSQKSAESAGFNANYYISYPNQPNRYLLLQLKYFNQNYTLGSGGKVVSVGSFFTYDQEKQLVTKIIQSLKFIP